MTQPTHCHADDRLTLDQAFDIVNQATDACPTCTELAWFLVGAALDGEMVGAS